MKFRSFFALGLAIICSACVDTSSPTRTIASAVNAIHKNEVDDLKATLTKEALANYGSQEGLKILQADLVGSKNLVLGKAVLMDETGRYRSYQQNLYGKKEGRADKERIWNMDLLCRFWEVQQSPSHPCNPQNPDCNMNPEPITKEYENCRIQGLVRGQTIP